MSKGLEALERLEENIVFVNVDYEMKHVADYDIIERELKALEILKKTKNIEVYFFDNGKRHYRIKFDRTKEQEISQEKYNILKEVFCNDISNRS